MANTKNKKRGRGRPANPKWSKVGLMWPNKTNKEIADFVGCSPANVSARRKRLMAKAVKEGRNPESYVCKVKYRRSASTEAQDS